MIDKTPRFSLTRNGLALDGELVPVVPSEPSLTDPWLRAKVEREWQGLEDQLDSLEARFRDLFEVKE